MSTLKVDGIRSNSASSDAITLASDGTCTANITNNLSNRNVIINGAMQVAQRGDTALGGDGYGGCDRFYWNESGGAAVTLKQGGASDSPVSEGFSNCQHVDVTTADTDMGTTNYNMLSTRLEGRDLQGFKKGTSNAEQFTLSFWIRSTVTGTYIVELIDQSNSSRHVNKAYTISASNTWEKKEITFPADTTGTITSDESRRLDVNWWFGAGTNYTSGTLQTSWGADTNANKAVGQVNAVNSTSNDIMLTGVQLEVGSVATDFAHRSYAQELALCQRYYYISGTPSGGGGLFIYDSGDSSISYGQLRFTQTMRATPTVVLRDNNGNTDGKATQHGAAHNIAATAASINSNGFSQVNKGSGNWTTGAGCPIICGCTATAEL